MPDRLTIDTVPLDERPRAPEQLGGRCHRGILQPGRHPHPHAYAREGCRLVVLPPPRLGRGAGAWPALRRAPRAPSHKTQSHVCSKLAERPPPAPAGAERARLARRRGCSRVRAGQLGEPRWRLSRRSSRGSARCERVSGAGAALSERDKSLQEGRRKAWGRKRAAWRRMDARARGLARRRALGAGHLKGSLPLRGAAHVALRRSRRTWRFLAGRCLLSARALG